MTEDQINGYIQIAQVLVAMGVDIGGKIKGLIKSFHPNHDLTDEQINAIEAAGMADSERRKQERIAMGQHTA